ncbi:hypothetical protein B7463_g3032, partial [Scytalidium lignicola]
MSTMKDSTRIKTAYALLDSYSILNVEALLASLTDSFTHKVLPELLEMPLRDKTAFAVHAERMASIFSTFTMVPQSVFEDQERNSVVIHAKMVGELINLGSWENECIIMLKMSDDGCKVVEQKEFVDSARAKLFQEKLLSVTKVNLFRDE